MKTKKRKKITVQIEVNLTPEQYDRVCQMAERRGETIMETVLQCLKTGFYEVTG